MLGRVADDRNDHDGDEELREIRRLGKRLQGVHEDLARQSRRQGGGSEGGKRNGKTPAGRTAGVMGGASPDSHGRDDEVENEQGDCRPDAE